LYTGLSTFGEGKYIPSGNIYACASDGAGGWFIAGDFKRVGGVVRNNIAHIKADKTLDLAWNASADGYVMELVVSGNDIFISGNFAKVNGETRTKLAKLNVTTGALDTAWNPSCSTYANKLLALGSHLYIVSPSKNMTINSTVVPEVARVSTTGTGALDTSWNLDPAGDVYLKSIAASSDGNYVFLGGNFQTPDYVGHPYLAKVSTTTPTIDASC
jgi:hypothetical protein